MTKTDITFVLDRSGSMNTIASDVQGGLKGFVKEQQSAEGDATFTLVHFDHEYETVIDAKDVAFTGIEDYGFNPRGSTALLDAIGRSVSETKERISAMPKGERPDKMLFVIFTDGGENSSKEFTKDQIKKLIESQTKEDWDFVFMGANQDAFGEGGGLGINHGSIVNYEASAAGTQAAFSAMSSNVTQYRCGTRSADNMFDGKENIESNE